MAKKYSSSKNAYDCNDSVNEADTNKASSRNSAKIQARILIHQNHQRMIMTTRHQQIVTMMKHQMMQVIARTVDNKRKPTIFNRL